MKKLTGMALWLLTGLASEGLATTAAEVRSLAGALRTAMQSTAFIAPNVLVSYHSSTGGVGVFDA